MEKTGQIDHGIITFTEMSPCNAMNNNDNPNDSSVFYSDNSSKKIIQILDTSIKIYNRNMTKQHKHIKLRIPKQQIQKIAVDCNIEYLTVLAEARNKELSILFISLIKEEVSYIDKIDNDIFVNMFFISQKNQMNPGEYIYFCFTLQKAMFYYSIERNTNKISLTKKMIYNDASKIEDSFYNRINMIHCVIRLDNSIDFYNYAHEENYDKSINVPFKKMQLGFKSNKNDTDIYRKIQFYLQMLFNKLYCIIYNCEINAIVLHHVQTLNNITKELEIKLPNKIIQGTLLFVDDLIALLDLIHWDITIIDCKSPLENKIIAKVKYDNSLGVNIQNIEVLRGDVIKNGIALFYPEVDYKKYYNIFPEKQKHDALLSLLGKKETKELILFNFREMIKLKRKAKHISVVLNTFASEVKKSSKPATDISSNSITKHKDDKNPSILVTPLQFLLKRHKRILRQIDIFYLFQSLIDCKESEKDILTYFSIFCKLAKSKKVLLELNFTNIMLNVMKNISIEKYYYFFLLKGISFNEDVAKYLLEKSETKELYEPLKLLFKQMAYDIFIKLGKTAYLFKHLIQIGSVKEALLFYNIYQPNIPIESIKEFLLSHKDQLNKRILLQYINS